MKKNTMIVLGLMLTCVSATVAQMTSPTPAPEIRKLDYFTGNWSTEATIAPGPWGVGGNLRGSSAGEWMKGGFFVVSHSDYVMPMELGGAKSATTIFGYDNDKKVYTEERFVSDGLRENMTGAVNGDTWTWTGNTNYNGMTFASRLTIRVLSPTSYTTKYEVATDGASWVPFWEGKVTKK